MVKQGLRFISVSCSHGDQIDPIAEKAVIEFVKDYKPALRIHLGDAFDFSALRKGASDEDKAMSLEDDWAYGSDFLSRYFDGGKENHLLLGNHDDRIYQLAHNSTGVMRDYAHDCIARFDILTNKSNIKTKPYDARRGVVKRGGLNFLHGYFAGKTAAQKHGNIYGPCIFGHTHTVESSPVERHDAEGTASSIGCLCKIDMEYNRRMPSKLRHQNAFCYGTVFPDNTSQVFISVRKGDNFYAALNVKRY